MQKLQLKRKNIVKRNDIDTEKEKERKFKMFNSTMNSLLTSDLDLQNNGYYNGIILPKCYYSHCPFDSNRPVENHMALPQSIIIANRFALTNSESKPPDSYSYGTHIDFPQSRATVFNPFQYYQSPSVIIPNSIYDYNAFNLGGQLYACSPVSVTVKPVEPKTITVTRRSSNDEFNSKENLNPVVESALNDTLVASVLCPKGQRGCNDGRLCIDESHFCNNEVNCVDGSDEFECSCKSRVGILRLCDGYSDCPNGDDEELCFGCSSNEFGCDDWTQVRNATCISVYSRCDGIIDCHISANDEKNCALLSNTLKVTDEISKRAGYLHRNYKGTWYPVCFGGEFWALNVCHIESDSQNLLPVIQFAVANISNGPFIQLSTEHIVEVVEHCYENRVLYVTCPALSCGLRSPVTNIFRNSEVDTSGDNASINPYSIIWRDRQSVGNDRLKRINSERVVGGKASQPGAWPWVVSVYRNGIFHCGGVIINEYWIITAAHCTDRYWQFYYEVYAGVLRRFSFAATQQNRWATVIVVHPKFNKVKLSNDIALMKLSLPLEFNKFIRAICLPPALDGSIFAGNHPVPGSICTAVGWGATIEHGLDPDHMREVEVPILSHCKHVEDEEGDEICAGLLEGGRDACQGDSGGPLLCRNINNPLQWYVAGIVSHGEGCARPNEPGVYTKVQRYIGWIHEVIGNDVPSSRQLPLGRCPGYECKIIGHCLPQRKRCDRIVDCILGDDEFKCTLMPIQELIAEDEFFIGDSLHSAATKNMNGQQLWKVNHAMAVTMNKTKNVSVHSTTMNHDVKNYFKCTMLAQIVPSAGRCNTIQDCEDGSDEENCHCRDYMQQLHSDGLCNGVVDCVDQSDETDCHNCNDDEFFCFFEKKCIAMAHRCDGEVHCKDMEDEDDCVTLTTNGTLAMEGQIVLKREMKGIVTRNHKGVWRPFCIKSANAAPSLANYICNLLDFEAYSSFHVILDTKKLINNTSNIRGSTDDYVNTFAICNRLYVACSNISINNNNKVNVVDNRVENIAQFKIPWNVAIFETGEYLCMGILLDELWIATSIGCFTRKSNAHNVVALLGKGTGFLDIPGPYDQYITITEMVSPTNSETTVFLRLEHNVQFNRQILPLHILKMDFKEITPEICITVGMRNNKVIVFPIKTWIECSIQKFCHRFAETVNACKDYNVESGILICATRGRWYAAASLSHVHNWCSLNETVFGNVNSLKYFENGLRGKIDTYTYSLVQFSKNNCNGYMCPLGKCIHTTKICDGIKDCYNGADEDIKSCDEKYLKCVATNKCECKKHQLRCRNGKCVAKSSFCNDVDDCGDLSDEPNNCTCQAYLALTHSERICDGKVDCFDRTDDNPELCSCAMGGVVCNRFGKRICVNHSMMCDGVVDCPDGEDELHCLALKTSRKRDGNHEVMTRTAGVWHSGCFKRNYTSTELDYMCQRIGFTMVANDSFINKTTNSTNKDGVNKALRPVLQQFSTLSMHRNKGGSTPYELKLRIGERPLITFVKDESCFKLFLQCV